MAITAEELRILVTAETKAATENLRRFKKTTKQTTLDIKGLAKKLIGPLGLAAGLGLVVRSMSKFVSEGVQFNAELEQINVSFETILGSGAAAAKIMDEIIELSASTPLQLKGLAEGTKRLLAFGTEADDAVDTMRRLGDTAQGNQETLNRLVDAYGKVQAKGRASLEELNRFTEAGVPIMKQLGENLGLTNEELFKFVSAGKVGFKEVDDALKSLTNEGGQFFGLMEKQSQTLAGTSSTLKDSFQLLRGEFVEGLTPAIIETNKWLTEKVNTLRMAVAAGNAYRRVIGNVTMNVKELALAEQEAFVANRIRDAEEAIKGLEKTLAARTGKSFIGGITTAIDAVVKALTGIERDRNADLIDDLRLLDQIVAFEKDRLVAIQAQIVAGGELTDVQIAEIERLKAAAAAAKAALNALAITKLFPTGGPAPFNPFIGFVNNLEDLKEGKKDVDNLKLSIRQLAEESLKLSFDNFVDSMAELAGSQALTTLNDIGRSMVDITEGTKSAAQAVRDWFIAMLKAIPQAMLAAGLQAVILNPADAKGWLLIAGSGLLSLISGAIEGSAANADAAAARSALPDPDTIAARTGITSRGDTVTVVQGNVFVQDELDGTIAATSTAMGGNR